MASKFIGYPSAGALGCIMIAFVAGVGWRRQSTTVATAETANTASDNTLGADGLQLQSVDADGLVSLYIYFYAFLFDSIFLLDANATGIFNILIFELEMCVCFFFVRFHPYTIRFEFKFLCACFPSLTT